ncbi:MAG: hypothetical protein LBT03_02005 [Holosporales bacterium]|jgi:hypothetical protein|nr:hypothetical protein [Holosporales bacterium]
MKKILAIGILAAVSSSAMAWEFGVGGRVGVTFIKGKGSSAGFANLEATTPTKITTLKSKKTSFAGDIIFMVEEKWDCFTAGLGLEAGICPGKISRKGEAFADIHPKDAMTLPVGGGWANAANNKGQVGYTTKQTWRAGLNLYAMYHLSECWALGLELGGAYTKFKTTAVANGSTTADANPWVATATTKKARVVPHVGLFTRYSLSDALFGQLGVRYHIRTKLPGAGGKLTGTDVSGVNDPKFGANPGKIHMLSINMTVGTKF